MELHQEMDQELAYRLGKGFHQGWGCCLLGSALVFLMALPTE